MSLPVDDPFTLLGLPQRLDLSPQQIQQAHMRAIAQAHPDAARHTSEDDVSGEDDAMVRSARLNHARSIVAHPERRAIALYRLLAQREGFSPDPKTEAALPPGFLMEIMSTREEIDAALAAKDDKARETWRSWALAQRATYMDRVGAALGQRDFAAAKGLLNAWRYIERLLEQLDPAYDPSKADFSS